MKCGGLLVAVYNKRGRVYEVSLSDDDKNYVFSLINQLQKSKNIKVHQLKFPMQIDIKKMKKRKD